MTTDLLDSKLHKYACEGKKSKLKAVLKNGKLNAFFFIHSPTHSSYLKLISPFKHQIT